MRPYEIVQHSQVPIKSRTLTLQATYYYLHLLKNDDIWREKESFVLAATIVIMEIFCHNVNYTYPKPHFSGCRIRDVVV